MIEEIADFDLLIEFAKELKRTGFRPGIDDMSGDSAALWLTINRDRLKRFTMAAARYPLI